MGGAWMTLVAAGYQESQDGAAQKFSAKRLGQTLYKSDFLSQLFNYQLALPLCEQGSELIVEVVCLFWCCRTERRTFENPRKTKDVI
jgi:hypothetical protein